MAKDIAALSSGDKTAFKAALAGMGYMVPIISAPLTAAASATIALPSGYSRFVLEYDITLSSAEDVSAIFSFDSGATWANDFADGTDTYALAVGQTIMAAGSVSTGSRGGSFWDSVASLGNGADSVFSWGTATIYPGSASELPRITNECERLFTGADNLYLVRSSVFFEPNATNPTTPARATTIRIGPRGGGDMTTPASGVTMTGYYALSGLVTPT